MPPVPFSCNENFSFEVQKINDEVGAVSFLAALFDATTTCEGQQVNTARAISGRDVPMGPFLAALA